MILMRTSFNLISTTYTRMILNKYPALHPLAIVQHAYLPQLSILKRLIIVDYDGPEMRYPVLEPVPPGVEKKLFHFCPLDPRYLPRAPQA